MEVAGAVEKMDTSSPPASPPTKENNISSEPSKKYESDDSNSHPSSTENSNGPVENNNEGSSPSENDNKSKTNGITPEGSQCSNSKESLDSQTTSSQKKSVSDEKANVQQDASKGTVGASDNDSRAQTNDEGSDEDGDSNDEMDSSDEGSEEESEVPGRKQAVSVNSDSEPETVDDDSTRDGQSDSENEDIVMIENTNEVHEIVSDDDDDDCVVTNEEGIKSVNGGSNLDMDSDVEESAEDPLNHNDKTNKITAIPIKALPPTPEEIKTQPQKDGASVVIIDTSSILSGKGPLPVPSTKVANSQPPISNQSIYESIAARGTTMTSVSVKSTSHAVSTTTPVQAVTQAPLLPTLTDDMFVVEAPSFIVPYVYEKPSVKPFREFVDVLGKELEDKKAKEDQESLEKEKAEKERRIKEKEERRAKGEEVEDSEEDIPKEDSQKEESLEENKDDAVKDKKEEELPKQKKDKKKGKSKRNRNDDDDASWDGESGSDSEEEAISEDDELTTVVIKDKDDDDDIEEIKTIATNLTTEAKTDGVKADSFFENNLGKFFMNIGLNLVQEYVQADLLRQQKRKLRKEAKSTRPNTKGIESAIGYLSKNLEFSKHQNAPYKFKQKNCKFCFFRTESSLIMEHHLETPHMKNNIYTCNFCPFEVRSPHDILFHMEAEHNTRSRLERAPAYHQCANCPFEDNGKGKLARHLIACAKKFKPDLNLAPPADWEPPAKIPKLTRARNMVPPYKPTGMPLGRPPTISGAPIPIMGRPRAPTMGVTPRGGGFVTGTPLVRGGVMMRQTTPIQPMNFPMGQSTPGGKIVHQPSISITPLPRTPQPAPAPARTQGTFVICEICDGYIKDLEQLRSHMQWIHKVKIHPKMIYNRPPLNCQKCQFRFFTDQGLERHLLGSHGLVTSSMQETANQGKDSGRCPVCGRVYQWKLLNHVAKDHNMTLKPAHLSYKCTVCTATFGMYKQFESHVYSMHSAVGKKVADNKPAKGVGGSSITIMPAGKAGAKV